MGNIVYEGTTINNSPTIELEAGEIITNGMCKAITMDANGNGVLAKAGDNAIGILLADSNDTIAVGERISIQIKDIGRWIAGAAVKAGEELTSDANGNAIQAVTGDFITAIALSTASATGSRVVVQIMKSGYKPA